MAKMDPARTLKDLIAEHFAGDKRVAAVYLFGSAARSPGASPRDLDVAFLMDGTFDSEADFAFPLRARSLLEEGTGLSVDVAILNSADPVLQHQVRRDGKVLLERNRRARLDWEVHSRKLWFDRQPAHRLYMDKLEARLSAPGVRHGG